MIKTEIKIHDHELSVALAKARPFQCYKTNLVAIGTKREKIKRRRRTRKQRRT